MTGSVHLCEMLGKFWTKTEVPVYSLSGRQIGTLFADPGFATFSPLSDRTVRVVFSGGLKAEIQSFPFEVPRTFFNLLVVRRESMDETIFRTISATVRAVFFPLFSQPHVTPPHKYYHCRCCDKVGDTIAPDYPKLADIDSVFVHKKAALEFVRGSPEEKYTKKQVAGYVANILAKEFRIGRPVPAEVLEKVRSFFSDACIDDPNIVFFSDNEFVIATEDFGVLKSGKPYVKSCIYFVAKKLPDGTYKRVRITGASEYNLWKSLQG